MITIEKGKMVRDNGGEPVVFHTIEDFMEATTFNEVRKTLLHIVQDANAARYYRALKTCKALIAYEDQVLAFGRGETTERPSIALETS